MQYRKLNPDDWIAYKDLRLKSLEEAPHAFESSLHEESQYNEGIWRSRLQQTLSAFCMGGFSDQQALLGIVGFRQGHKLKTQHKSYLWGVYVLPEQRGSGLGKGLIEAVINEFEGLFDVSLMQLTVTSNNISAIRLYQKLGFEQYGMEKDAIRVNGQSYDELLMCLVKNDVL